MPRNQIVINVDVGETRVALIENGIVTELHIERGDDKSVVGNVYIGRVTRVLPGMNAAFVEIGQDRAAFLHLDDVVSEGELRGALRDDDMEASESHTRTPAREVPPTPPAVEPAITSQATATPGEPTMSIESSAATSEHVAPASSESSAEFLVAGDAQESDGEPDDDDEDEPETAPANGEEDAQFDGPERDEGEATFSDMLAETDAPGVVPSRVDAAITAPRAPERQGNRGRDRRGRGGRRKDFRNGGGGGGAPHGRNVREPERQQRSNGPSKAITDVLREGQDIVVQVSKGPISTKGARVTSHISLPGRYVVYMPTVDHIGVSKRIGNEKERRRLREVIEQFKPEKGGLIVRTASEGLTKKQLKNDVGYLVQLWGDIWRKREGAKAPALLYGELDVVLRTVRDVMGPEIEKIVIDDAETHARCVRFVEQFMPDRKDDVTLYTGSDPIFDEYGIEDEIARALSRKVPLKSGGYLIIDEAEALTAIDVNSGRFVGKKDVEDTVTQTNLEAVSEIAYQLRLRNLGGLIILDLIDMDRQGNRDKVYRALNDALRNDKAKTSILRISELGLVEMTRKRTRESLGRQLYEPCFYCDGTGHTQSKLTIAHEIVRQIRREKDQLPGYNIVVNAHPAVADTLKHEAKATLEEVQRQYMRRIIVQSKPEYHIEQFDLQGQ